MHLVSPINFRLGKTFPWKNNILISNNKNSIQTASDLTLTHGLEQFSNYLLQKYRMFAIKGALRYYSKTNLLVFNLLYIPRMKEKTFDGAYATDSDPISNILYASRRIIQHSKLL